MQRDEHQDSPDQSTTGYEPFGKGPVFSDEGADTPLAARLQAGEPLVSVLARRMSRRAFLYGTSRTLPLLLAGPVFGPCTTATSHEAPEMVGTDSLTFAPIEGGETDDVVVPEGYRAEVVIRWGDALQPDIPDLPTNRLASGYLLREPAAAEHQALQFGYNCDACVYFPLPDAGSSNDREGLVCVNHEYTTNELMFPGFPGPDAIRGGLRRKWPENVVKTYLDSLSRDESERFVRVTQAAHGLSVVAVTRNAGSTTQWIYHRDSPFNRRITANTPIVLSGPTAGHRLLRTKGDATGTRVLGTLNNCAGGRTPWGTYLSCEENFDHYFGGLSSLRSRLGPDATPESQWMLDAHERIPLDEHSSHGWEFVDERFDMNAEPHEPFRFGWVVELDPYNSEAVPRKRTALGRFKHECARAVTARNGRLAVYMGDDARFEYIYKFVSRDRVEPESREANAELLDHGTLYVARLRDDGTGAWVPLDYQQSPVLREAFADQGEILINARAAADLLGATPMDRPEDIEVVQSTGHIYVALTNNDKRRETDLFNPRPDNRWGHIFELIEDQNDHTATTFRWNVFILCGDPGSVDGHFLTSAANLAEGSLTPDDTYFGGYSDPSAISPLGSPDNLSSDQHGNLWIVTDGRQPRGTNNGCFAVPTTGQERGRVRQFASGPVDCELCGCEFTPGDKTLFLSIQHPGDGGSLSGPTPPTSNWPDGGNLPPRPSLIAITKVRGEPRIGTGTQEASASEP